VGKLIAGLIQKANWRMKGAIRTEASRGRKKENDICVLIGEREARGGRIRSERNRRGMMRSDNR
jgi:hypothetical protein